MTSDPLPPPPSRPPPSGLRAPSSRIPLLAGLLVAGGALVTGGYVVWKGQQAPPVPVAGPATPEAPAPAPPPDEAGPAPSVAESDARVRDLVGLLSPQPELQRWLSSTQDLVRRFTSAVDALAEGQSPRAALAFLGPPGGFQVLRREERLVIAPESFARYDSVARVVTSLDTSTSVITYQALRPLIEGAYREISRPGQRFDQTLANAVQSLVDTPVPEVGTELEVVDSPGVNFTFASPELEGLSAARKHLVRMGPANARAIQAKLRELRDALGLPPATAPAPPAPAPAGAAAQ